MKTIICDLRSIIHLFREAGNSWMESKTARLGASLAYYTIFAVAPLFIVALLVAGAVFGKEAAHRELYAQINGLVGEEGGKAVEAMIQSANQPKASLWATIGAITTLAAGATAVFIELQDALNTIWHVQRKKGHGVRYFIKDRLISFAMVLGVGFLLLVSLVLNAALAGVAHFASGPDPAHTWIWGLLNFTVSLAVITLLFAMIFKILPDVPIAWEDVWVGAFFTALLFNLGKLLIGSYLGRSTTVSIYGAAGSFIVLLLWVYYSAQIVFFGAEFTRVYSRRNLPEAAGAVKQPAPEKPAEMTRN